MNQVQFFLLMLFIFSTESKAQNYTISGYIEDSESGESIAAANVFDVRSQLGTISNDFGFFSLSLPHDTVHLVISFVGYQSRHLVFYHDSDRELQLQLQPAIELEPVEISTTPGEIGLRSRMSRIDLQFQEIVSTPVLLGESDVLKTIQLLPGVQSGTEGQSGVFVRGGSIDQNLILLDGVPVYNASHLFGFVSVFNTDAVKSVNLYKGGFPSRYAGRISSIIDIDLKEGNMKKWQGSGSVGLISTKVSVEGPLKKDTSSLFFAYRRSYLDIIAKPVLKKIFAENGGKIGYHFYDANFKINYKLSKKDHIYWSFYSGRDAYRRKDELQSDSTLINLDVGLNWQNATSAFRWNHIWGQKLFSNTTLTYSRFRYRTRNHTISNTSGAGELSTTDANLDYQAGIEDVALRVDFDYAPSSNHLLHFGGAVIRHHFTPGMFDLSISREGVGIIDTVFEQSTVDAVETGLYLEDEWEIMPWWRIHMGLHLAGYNTNEASYQSLQPRIATHFSVRNRFSMKASYSKMAQYVQLLTNEGIGLPTDLWLPSTQKITPQTGWQTALGMAAYSTDYEVGLEGYYRRMLHSINYKAGASLLEVDDWQDKIIQGEGKGYGLELFVRKKTGKWRGWLGYTLSWSKRRFDAINNGKWYYFRYDRRHDFSIVSTYDLSERFRISGTWVYASGNPVTLYTNSFGVTIPRASVERPSLRTGAVYIPGRNNFRLGDYHRLDLGVDYKWKNKNLVHRVTLGGYNLYNRRNPFYIVQVGESYRRSDGSTGQKLKLKEFGLFPFIPSLKYTINWEL